MSVAALGRFRRAAVAAALVAAGAGPGAIAIGGEGRAPAVGPLVIVGGHEDKEGDREILGRFVRLAGGKRARVLVMMYASRTPEDVERTYRRAFGLLGVEAVRGLVIEGDEELDRPAALEDLEWASGVFITGGKQGPMMGNLTGSRFAAALGRRCGEGLVVGGTSAGAAMMPEMMLIDGDSEECPRAGGATLGRGMGFIRGVVIDSHFAQRGRIGRLLTAVAEHPDKLGLGIGEDTAMVVDGDEFEVIGRGVVTVLDAGHLAYTNAEGLGKEEPIALFGVKLHTIPAGCRFNLRTRSPIRSGERRDDPKPGG